MANPDSFWGESDDARERNIEIFKNTQHGLDADGNPFKLDDDYDEEDDG